MKKNFANPFACRGSAGLARDGYRESARPQSSRQLSKLRALAAAVESFEGDEFSARGHVRNDNSGFLPIAATIADQPSLRSKRTTRTAP